MNYSHTIANRTLKKISKQKYLNSYMATNLWNHQLIQKNIKKCHFFSVNKKKITKFGPSDVNPH